jgi:hypothetical protein
LSPTRRHSFRNSAGIILAALMAATRPAAASGAVWCRADDAALTFAMRSGVSRGISGGFLNFTADLTIRLAGIPGDFRTLHFGGAGITQHWFDAKEFRLELARERATGPSGYVRFDVLTRLVSEGQFRGRYTLRVLAQLSGDSEGRDWQISGPIACSTE